MLDIIKQIFYAALPRICVCCGFNCKNEVIDLCVDCKNLLPWIGQRCCCCGLRLNSQLDAIVCNKCRDKQLEFNNLHAMFEYVAPITKLINQLKFSKKISLGSLFGVLLAETAIKYWYVHKPLPEVIIPVPLHEDRLRSRGYNQVLEFCIPAAKILQVPINVDLCRRVKYTQQQTRLHKSQRIINLQGAFILNSQPSYKHVAIVDDVVTTASTVTAISQAVRAAGVECIDIWCLARA